MSKRRASSVLILVLTTIGCFSLAQTPQSAANQTPSTRHDEQYEKDKRYALELYEQQNFMAALPWAEKLYAQDPKDPQVVELYAMATLASAATLEDAEQSKATRVKARKLFEEAKGLGVQSNLTDLMLDQIPMDGSRTPFSQDKEIEGVMRAAEADFISGRLDEALHGYIRALLLDPNLYTAAVFAGDVYFKQGKQGSAGEWYARAIKIDPNQETAYRYWGDSLMKMGKPAEAREKFINAVVADPYNRASWMGLMQWAEANKLKLTIPQIKSPNSVEKKDEMHININIDPKSMEKKGGGSAWFIYTLMKASWQGDKFKEKFPNEKQYRHTLAEEHECLSAAADSLAGDFPPKKRKKLSPELTSLLQLHESGLIEPYVLISAPDEGIAKDYATYREQNRDKLYRYMDEVVVPKIGEQ